LLPCVLLLLLLLGGWGRWPLTRWLLHLLPCLG
jgi:hypothetical protein